MHKFFSLFFFCSISIGTISAQTHRVIRLEEYYKGEYSSFVELSYGDDGRLSSSLISFEDGETRTIEFSFSDDAIVAEINNPNWEDDVTKTVTHTSDGKIVGIEYCGGGTPSEMLQEADFVEWLEYDGEYLARVSNIEENEATITWADDNIAQIHTAYDYGFETNTYVRNDTPNPSSNPIFLELNECSLDGFMLLQPYAFFPQMFGRQSSRLIQSIQKSGEEDGSSYASTYEYSYDFDEYGNVTEITEMRDGQERIRLKIYYEELYNGIHNIQSPKSRHDEVYNLSGQRTTQNSPGLYIIKGVDNKFHKVYRQ